jgi:hypothetical protein
MATATRVVTNHGMTATSSGCREMRRRWLTGLLALVLTSAAVGSAVADPIPGATYNGVAADGARIRLTVSSDGTLVDSYDITGVFGQEPGGGTCQFTAAGASAVWEGAPIVNTAFEYQLGDAILFQGTFPGGQASTGTFRLYDAASSQTPACDTGVVSWTATTTATPRGGPGGGLGGGPGSGGGSGHKRRFATRVTFRRASSKMLRGQIKSPARACRAGRTVILWRGKHRIGSTKAAAGGKFFFARTALVRGRTVRASTPARSVPAGACAAGSSTFIRG